MVRFIATIRRNSHYYSNYNNNVVISHSHDYANIEGQSSNCLALFIDFFLFTVYGLAMCNELLPSITCIVFMQVALWKAKAYQDFSFRWCTDINITHWRNKASGSSYAHGHYGYDAMMYSAIICYGAAWSHWTSMPRMIVYDRDHRA